MVRSFSVPITIPLIEWGRSVSKKKLNTRKASVRRKFVSPNAQAATPKPFSYISVGPVEVRAPTDKLFPDFVHVTLPPAPFFEFKENGNFATIYMAHYDRLVAVVEAAKSGNKSLIRMALAELDRLGSSKETA